MDERAPHEPGAAASGGPAARIEPGTVVGGRWRVARRLGAQRLDEIYQGTEIESGKTVAIRVVRRDAGLDDPTFRRFVRVARRLAAIDHPNVQRIHGFATHETEVEGKRERAALLVTELLSGETLSHRVRRQGPLVGEALDNLVRDLCSGLDAIHRARALHGDITGASVVFVGEPDAPSRAVLSDLAFLSSGEGDEQAMARAVGSPAYRAPEQLTGGKLHRATDIFSLGAVIYEAATGRLPFTGGNLLALDFRQLEEEPRSPRELAPSLDPSLERTILRCLERSPANRFERATELLRAARGESVYTPRFRQAARTLGAASLLIAVMLGGSAFLSWISVVEDRRLGMEMVKRSRPAIAVMPFRDAGHGPGDAWVAVAAAELLRLALTADDSLRVAPRDAVVDACRDLELDGVETLPPRALRHIGVLLGSEHAIVGSCTVDGRGATASVTIDLCIQDTATGEVVGAIRDAGTVEGLPELAARLAAQVRPLAGSTERAAAPRGGATARGWSRAGLKAWANGLADLDARRASAAVSSLALAATTDADNPAVRLDLSRALWASGDVARAIDEAKRAWDASEGLSPERALEAELRHAELRNDPGRLIEAYRRVIRTYPDRIDHGFGLVEAFISAGDLEDARRALRSLQSATSPDLDPRPALYAARIAAHAGRHADALAAASDAASVAAAIGARGIEGEAEVERALSAASLGEVDLARRAIANAREAFSARGDLDEVARITVVSAALEQREGRWEAALGSLREAQRIYGEIGQRQGLAATRGSLGVLLSSRGRHRDAAREFGAALDGFVSIGDRDNATRTRIGLAESLFALGALSAAESQLRSVTAAGAQEPDPTHRGLALLGLARIETARGRVARSSELLDQAAAQFEIRRVADGELEIQILRGTNSWLRGDDDAARRLLSEVRWRAGQSGNIVEQCRAAMQLARVELGSGDAEAALASASSCIEFLDGYASPGDAVRARSVAALAALRTGDRSRAAALVEPFARGEGVDDDFDARVAAEIARETVRGGRPAPLLRLASEAEANSMRVVQLDALVAAARLSTRPAERSATSSRAEALARRLELPAYARLAVAARSAPGK